MTFETTPYHIYYHIVYGVIYNKYKTKTLMEEGMYNTCFHILIIVMSAWTKVSLFPHSNPKRYSWRSGSFVVGFTLHIVTLLSRVLANDITENFPM